jgi:hypothetical protein
MGGRNSKLVSNQLGALETKIKDLSNSVYQIQDDINNLPKNYMVQSDFDNRIQKVEDDSVCASQQLTQLLELTKEQQQVILDLGDQYTQVCDICDSQQESVELIDSRCKEKLALYEVEISEAAKKMDEVEKGVLRTSELARIMGIRKTESMIKKERVTPSTKKSEKKTVEKAKPRENASVKKSVPKSGKKSQKKASVLKLGTNENDASAMLKIENQAIAASLAAGKRSERKSTHKESLSKCDFNIF